VSTPFGYLHIQAFIKPKSPFVLVQNSTMFSGLCE
jgi:hypothetical protein